MWIDTHLLVCVAIQSILVTIFSMRKQLEGVRCRHDDSSLTSRIKDKEWNNENRQNFIKLNRSELNIYFSSITMVSNELLVLLLRLLPLLLLFSLLLSTVPLLIVSLHGCCINYLVKMWFNAIYNSTNRQQNHQSKHQKDVR